MARWIETNGWKITFISEQIHWAGFWLYQPGVADRNSHLQFSQGPPKTMRWTGNLIHLMWPIVISNHIDQSNFGEDDILLVGVSFHAVGTPFQFCRKHQYLVWTDSERISCLEQVLGEVQATDIARLALELLQRFNDYPRQTWLETLASQYSAFTFTILPLEL